MNFPLNYPNITFWLAVAIAYWIARKKELPSPGLSIILGAIIGRVVSALAAGMAYALLHMHWIGAEVTGDPTFADLFYTGSKMGGLASLAAGGMACLLYWYLTGRPTRYYQSAVIPALAIGTAFARLAAWITVDFDMGPPAPFAAPPLTVTGGTGDIFHTDGVPLWNLPLLELVIYLGYAERSRKVDFLNSFWSFFVFYSLVNFLFEFFAWSPPLLMDYLELAHYTPKNAESILNHSWTGLTYKQVLSLIIGIPSLVMFMISRKTAAHVA